MDNLNSGHKIVHYSNGSITLASDTRIVTIIPSFKVVSIMCFLLSFCLFSPNGVFFLKTMTS